MLASSRKKNLNSGCPGTLKNALLGCLFLDFFVKHSPNHLSFHYEKLFLVNNIFKNLYIQIKNLYGYKLVSAEKQSKKILKDPVSIKEGITQSNVNYLHKRKSKYLCHLLHS